MQITLYCATDEYYSLAKICLPRTFITLQRKAQKLPALEKKPLFYIYIYTI